MVKRTAVVYALTQTVSWCGRMNLIVCADVAAFLQHVIGAHLCVSYSSVLLMSRSSMFPISHVQK